MADYVILPAAKTEYDNAFDWYFAEDPRRAGRFETAVERAIAAITDTPEWWSPYDDRHGSTWSRSSHT
jgi:plasmid stabilization system protein ParE